MAEAVVREVVVRGSTQGIDDAKAAMAGFAQALDQTSTAAGGTSAAIDATNGAASQSAAALSSMRQSVSATADSVAAAEAKFAAYQARLDPIGGAQARMQAEADLLAAAMRASGADMSTQDAILDRLRSSYDLAGQAANDASALMSGAARATGADMTATGETAQNLSGSLSEVTTASSTAGAALAAVGTALGIVGFAPAAAAASGLSEVMSGIAVGARATDAAVGSSFSAASATLSQWHEGLDDTASAMNVFAARSSLVSKALGEIGFHEAAVGATALSLGVNAVASQARQASEVLGMTSGAVDLLDAGVQSARESVASLSAALFGGSQAAQGLDQAANDNGVRTLSDTMEAGVRSALEFGQGLSHVSSSVEVAIAVLGGGRGLVAWHNLLNAGLAEIPAVAATAATALSAWASASVAAASAAAAQVVSAARAAAGGVAAYSAELSALARYDGAAVAALKVADDLKAVGAAGWEYGRGIAAAAAETRGLIGVATDLGMGIGRLWVAFEAYTILAKVDLAMLGLAADAVFAMSTFEKFTAAQMAAAAEQEHLALQYGVTRQSMVALDGVVQQFGLSQDQASGIAQRLMDAIRGTGEQGQQARAILEAYGVSLRGLTASDWGQVLDQWVVRTRDLGSSTEKLAAYTAVLGDTAYTVYQKAGAAAQVASGQQAVVNAMILEMERRLAASQERMAKMAAEKWYDNTFLAPMVKILAISDEMKMRTALAWEPLISGAKEWASGTWLQTLTGLPALWDKAGTAVVNYARVLGHNIAPKLVAPSSWSDESAKAALGGKEAVDPKLITDLQALQASYGKVTPEQDKFIKEMDLIDKGMLASANNPSVAKVLGNLESLRTKLLNLHAAAQEVAAGSPNKAELSIIGQTEGLITKYTSIAGSAQQEAAKELRQKLEKDRDLLASRLASAGEDGAHDVDLLQKALVRVNRELVQADINASGLGDTAPIIEKPTKALTNLGSSLRDAAQMSQLAASGALAIADAYGVSEAAGMQMEAVQKALAGAYGDTSDQAALSAEAMASLQTLYGQKAAGTAQTARDLEEQAASAWEIAAATGQGAAAAEAESNHQQAVSIVRGQLAVLDALQLQADAQHAAGLLTEQQYQTTLLDLDGRRQKTAESRQKVEDALTSKSLAGQLDSLNQQNISLEQQIALQGVELGLVGASEATRSRVLALAKLQIQYEGAIAAATGDHKAELEAAYARAVQLTGAYWQMDEALQRANATLGGLSSDMESAGKTLFRDLL